jgi:hypothetical protein
MFSVVRFGRSREMTARLGFMSRKVALVALVIGLGAFSGWRLGTVSASVPVDTTSAAGLTGSTYVHDSGHQLLVRTDESATRLGSAGASSSAGAVAVAVGPRTEAAAGFAAEDLPAMSIDDAQFGAKIGKHAGDYGLDPADPAARDYLRNLITDIRGNADEVRVRSWNPKGGGGDAYLFFRQGSDVVVTQPDGSFVTIVKGGENNGWFQGAMPR